VSLGGSMLVFGRWCQKVAGTVTFGTTRGALDDGRRGSRHSNVRMPENALMVTGFVQQIKDTCGWNRGPNALFSLIQELQETYGSDPGC